jgi:hypothetical protein
MRFKCDVVSRYFALIKRDTPENTISELEGLTELPYSIKRGINFYLLKPFARESAPAATMTNPLLLNKPMTNRLVKY